MPAEPRNVRISAGMGFVVLLHAGLCRKQAQKLMDYWFFTLWGAPARAATATTAGWQFCESVRTHFRRKYMHPRCWQMRHNSYTFRHRHIVLIRAHGRAQQHATAPSGKACLHITHAVTDHP